jgi:hypothetical protein
MAGGAMADPYSQTIDFTSSSNPYWNGTWDSPAHGKYITEGSWLTHHPYSYLDNDPFNYTHDVTSLLAPGDTITSANLTLDFYDDDSDSGRHAKTEYVRLSFDGVTWNNLGETDTGTAGPFSVLACLTDRILNVSVNLYGSQDYSEDIYLKSSTLSGDFTPYQEPPRVPVPAAVVIGMLGLGTAGIRLRRFA